MSSDIHNRLWARLVALFACGHFAGRRITITDPDDASGRTRNTYEDLDQESGEERQALVTIFPAYAKAQAAGTDDVGLETLTHTRALADIKLMIEKFGYRLAAIEKDILRELPRLRA